MSKLVVGSLKDVKFMLDVLEDLRFRQLALVSYRFECLSVEMTNFSISGG